MPVVVVFDVIVLLIIAYTRVNSNISLFYVLDPHTSIFVYRRRLVPIWEQWSNITRVVFTTWAIRRSRNRKTLQNHELRTHITVTPIKAKAIDLRLSSSRILPLNLVHATSTGFQMRRWEIGISGTECWGSFRIQNRKWLPFKGPLDWCVSLTCHWEGKYIILCYMCLCK